MKAVKVAIVDSGIDASHLDIGRIADGVKIETIKCRAVVFSANFSDYLGHGTACAGIIKKAAPDAELYSVRIFDASLAADGQALVAAIQWCIDNRMDVVNLSLGTSDVSFKASLRKVCRGAVDAGLILVGAQNNEGTESFPAVFPQVIGVTGGAIHKADEFYFRPNHWIECIAKGDEQWVCWLNGKRIRSAGNSFAAPHITGIIANLLIQHPKWSLHDIRSWLQENASRRISNQYNPCLTNSYTLKEEVAHAIQSLNELPQVDVPVICIAGTGPAQGKFTLQRALARILTYRGFRVAQLDKIPQDTLLPKNFVPYLDYKMRVLCQRKRPDIILTGPRSNTIPFDPTDDGVNCIPALSFLLGARPDACVLVVNDIDPIEYIRDTIYGIHAICKAPTLALAMGDPGKRIRTAYTGRSRSEMLGAATISDHLKKLEDTFQLPAVAIPSEAGQRRLAETVIRYFSKESPSTAVETPCPR